MSKNKLCLHSFAVVLQGAGHLTGTLVRSIKLITSSDDVFGLAVSPDGAHMVTSHGDNTLSVYSLPCGEHLTTFGSIGTNPCQFYYPATLCFTARGTVMVAEACNMRLQEVTLAGEHVRFIGVGVIDASICGIAANSELIVTGKSDDTTNNRIMMFDAVTGALVRAFGSHGYAPGQLMAFCAGIRFTPDGLHIIVAENDGGSAIMRSRVSQFSLRGEFVGSLGELPAGVAVAIIAVDVEFADNGDIICSDFIDNTVRVHCAKSRELLCQWGSWHDLQNVTDHTFMCPTSLAVSGRQLFVLDCDPGVRSVHVFS